MKVTIKGGEVLSFPDNMSKEEIQEALRKKFPKKVKDEIVREIIKEVPKIVEKEVIKEVIKEVKVKDHSLAPMQIISETLNKIERMLNKPPVIVKEITNKPEIIIKEVERIKREKVTGWTFEVTERDENENILQIEATPHG